MYGIPCYYIARQEKNPLHNTNISLRWQVEALISFKFSVMQISPHSLCLSSWTAKQCLLQCYFFYSLPLYAIFRLWNLQLPFPSATMARAWMISVLVLGAYVDIPITAGKLAHTMSWLSCVQIQEMLDSCVGGLFLFKKLLLSCLRSCCHILQGIRGEHADVALAVIHPEAWNTMGNLKNPLISEVPNAFLNKDYILASHAQNLFLALKDDESHKDFTLLTGIKNSRSSLGWTLPTQDILTSQLQNFLLVWGTSH